VRHFALNTNNFVALSRAAIGMRLALLLTGGAAIAARSAEELAWPR
jgi:hypothetical protein